MMFETHYNDEMAAEVKKLEAKARATVAGHPDWQNACAFCSCELTIINSNCCELCRVKNE
jgi:hypothetical protein